MYIEDGKGTTNKAEVKNHALKVTSGDEVLEANRRGDGYVLIVDAITISAADYIIALIINKDGAARDMVVTHFNMRSADDSSAGYEVNLGGTFTHDVANGTLILPSNLRSGDAAATHICGAECYVNDGDGDMTTEANAYLAYNGPRQNKSSFNRGWVEGGWVVPYGQTISISAQVADIFQGTIQFYFCES